MDRDLAEPPLLSARSSRERNDPGRLQASFFGIQVASDCAIASNVFVHSPNEPEKSSIDVLSPRLELKTARRDQVATGCFAIDINGLRPVDCKPLSVQTDLPCRASNVVVFLKDIMEKYLRSSNPAASLSDNQGASRGHRGCNRALAVPS